jgi:hypothetical protein
MRVRVKPGQAIPQHEHATNRVTVALTPARIKLTMADGSTSESVFAAGEAHWGTPGTHAEKNDMAEPFELVLVDIKGK